MGWTDIGQHWLLTMLLVFTTTTLTQCRQHRGTKDVDTRHKLKILPSSELCSSEGFFRHPNDCKLYLRCVDEFGNGRELQAFEGRCEPGLVFDDNISACNWPQLAPPCNDIPSEKNSILLHREPNKKPFKRNGNNKVMVPIPFLGSQPTKTNSVSQEVVVNDQHIFVEPLLCKSEGFFAHPSVCNEFYRCKKLRSHFVVEVYKCPKENDVFGSVEGACVTRNENMTLECENNVNRRRNKRAAEDEKLTCQSEGFFRHPKDCNAFYRCVEVREGVFTTYMFACPSTLVFDEEASTCNWPQRTTPCEQSSGARRVAKPKPAQRQPPQQPYGTRLSNSRPITTKRPPTRQTQRPPSRINQRTPSKQTERPHSKQTQRPHSRQTQRPPSRQTQRPPSRQSPSRTKATTKRPQIGNSPTKFSQNTGNGCKASGTFPNPSQCGKFYRCVSVRRGVFKRYDLECPGNQAFDFRKSECSLTHTCYSSRNFLRRPQNDEEQGTTTSVAPASEGLKSSADSENIECKEEGYFRHPSDCNKFYRCVDFKGDGQSYVRYDFDCPEGLIFDEVNSVCNWPEQTPPCEAKSSGGGDSGGNGETDETAGGTDESTGGSEGQEGTEDGGGESSTDGQAGEDGEGERGGDGTEAGSSGGGGGECTSAGYFRDPSDCSKFYRCVDFKGDGQEFVRYDFECPEGLVFDEGNAVCNWPDKSPPCEGGSSQGGGDRETEGEDGSSSSTDAESGSSESSREQTEGSTSQKGGSSDECTEEGFFRNSDDCNKFHRCVDNGEGTFIRYDFVCPEGLIFDEVNSVCNWPQQTPGCDSGRGSEGGDKTGEQQSTTSASGEDSSSSTESSASESSSSEPSGSEESSTSGGDSSTNAPETSSPSKSDGECNTEGYFRKSQDCVEFYRCVQEEDGSYTRYDFECPEGLIFDEKNVKCDWPSEQNTCEASGGSTDGSGQCTEEGFYQDPNDCRKYYRCLDEEGDGSLTKTEYSCKEGEVFDEEMRFCNKADPEDPCKVFDPEKGSSSSGSTSGTEESGSESSTASSGSSGTTGGGSRSTECVEEGFFRNPDDCSKFYRCVDNGDGKSYVKYDFDCPKGLVFDEANEVCNWPDQSPSCEASGQPTPDESTPDSGSSSSQTTDSSAESGSTSSGRDGSTESSQSGGQDTSTSSSASGGDGGSTKSPPSSSIQCTQEGFYRHPDDCSKFYRCVDFKGDGQSYVRYDFECPEGLVFDETNSVCNWPDQSPPCGGGDSTEGSDSADADEGQCKEEGFFQNPKDCTKYYQCERSEDNGELSRKNFQCPDGHFFDEEGRYCNSDDFGQQCRTGDGSSGGQDGNGGDGGEQSPKEFECKEEGFFRDPKDCGSYYRCTANDDGTYEKEHEQCPDGHVFDEGGRYCNSDELIQEKCSASTGDRSTSSSGGTTESSGSTTESSGSKDVTPSHVEDRDCSEEGFFRNPDDCTKYYQCTRSGDGFEKEDFQCPDGHIFDEEGRYCNTEEFTSQSCASAGSSSGTDSSGTTDSSDGSDSTDSSSSESPPSSGEDTKRKGECTEEGFFRNPDDCNKFYRCVDFKGDGQSYVRYDFDCPEGLHFDEVNSVCNWPTMTPPCENA